MLLPVGRGPAKQVQAADSCILLKTRHRLYPKMNIDLHGPMTIRTMDATTRINQSITPMFLAHRPRSSPRHHELEHCLVGAAVVQGH